MRRTGRVIIVFFLVFFCMAGLWLFQSFRESRVVKTKKEYRNVYITDVKQQKVEGIWRGQKKTWQLRSAVSKEKISGVADLIEEQGKVVKVRKKPDMIQGKILRIMDKKLQIENYGFVSLDAEFCVYHLKSDGIVTPGEVSELSVGESEAKYVAASGKICAVLLYEQKEKTANIRVILQNDKNHSYDFSSVTLSGTTGYTVVAGKKKTHFDASKKQKLTAQNVTEHIVVIPDTGGKIRVESVNKQYGHPEYRGIFEIDLVDKALHIINELPLEEYLYSVVPSEMPTEYQKEALKAQAVCARSYAIKQMAGKRLAALGAHVDDSVAFQVYNNLREDAASIAAVNETKGQVVFAENQVAETYFYSVSAGVSAGIKEVWFAKKDRSYLMPCVLLGDSRKTLDLQTTDNLANLKEEASMLSIHADEDKNINDLQLKKPIEIVSKDETKSYDTNSPWYRWRTTVSEKQLQQFISEKIKSRYEKNPTQIQTKQKDGTFFSTGQTELGEIKKVEILKRGKSGVAVMAQITGSKNTLRIYTEYNLRNLFGGEKLIYLRKDKKEVSGLSCLPSGYFTIEKKGDSYIFTGGGYGHGVGMSQNGANQMAAQGKKCEEILKFYFLGSILQYQKSV